MELWLLIGFGNELPKERTPMKTTIVLAVLLAATPAFAQSSGGPGSPGATMHDYKLGPHQHTTRHRRQPIYNSQQRTAPTAPEAAGGGAVKQPMGRP